ncbi:hypothetical protein HNQ03_003101 [Chryseobacterium sp. 16F]|uniref:Uncharacterized protein n=1 Tax=Frigoriflavimonas asaccharolytica TaxID=2735899 RepID=A0A8J8K9T6_9FLAO|nr:hypothetical protein [Frigoriflavimonas asaccharolytica]
MENIKEDISFLDDHRKNSFGGFLHRHNFAIFKEYITFLCHYKKRLVRISFNQLIPLFEETDFALILPTNVSFFGYHYDERDNLQLLDNVLYILPYFNDELLNTDEKNLLKYGSFIYYLKKQYNVKVTYDETIIGHDIRHNRDLKTIILQNLDR